LFICQCIIFSSIGFLHVYDATVHYIIWPLCYFSFSIQHHVFSFYPMNTSCSIFLLSLLSTICELITTVVIKLVLTCACACLTKNAFSFPLYWHAHVRVSLRMRSLFHFLVFFQFVPCMLWHHFIYTRDNIAVRRCRMIYRPPC